MKNSFHCCLKYYFTFSSAQYIHLDSTYSDRSTGVAFSALQIRCIGIDAHLCVQTTNNSVSCISTCHNVPFTHVLICF